MAGWKPTQRFSPAIERYVRAAEAAWNSRDPDKILLAGTIECQWRKRANFLWGSRSAPWA
nr:DUF1348 family protein [Sphingomonas psychrotolerans]